MDATNTDFHTGHRNRLRQKFLDDKLADYELLELMLGYVIPRRDVRPLARGLIKQFGGINQILTAPLDDLIAFPGMGRNTAIFFKVINHIMIIGYAEKLKERPVFHNEQILTNYCRAVLSGKTVEEFHVLYLDDEMRLVADDVHTRGTSDESAVYQREILKRALVLNTSCIVMLHNHPTPGRSFSTDDVNTTLAVEKFLGAVGVRLYDHYVVSGGIVYSMRGMHLLK